MGLHARLTADSSNYVQAIDQARDSLVDLQQQAKLLKQGEKDITKAIEENTQKFGENSKQVQRCKSDLEDNLKAQLEVKSQVQQVNTQLSKLQKEYIKAAEAAAQDTQEVNDNAQAFESSAERLKSAYSAIKGIAVSYAGKKLFDALIGSSEDFEQSMVSFEVLLQSAEKAQAQMDQLERFGAKTPFELTDVTEATKQLLAFGVAEEDVMTRLQQLGDLSQGKAELLDRITSAYGKMQAKGKVTLEELNMLTEAGVPILQELANQYGVTQEALFKMISAGEVNIDGINKAMEAMTSEGGQFYGMTEKQSQTMAGLWSTFMDNISMMARQAGEEGFQELKDELQGLLDTVTSLVDSGAAEQFGSGVAVIISAVANLISLLWDLRGVLVTVGAGWAVFKVSPIITTVTTAVKALTSAETIQNVVTGQSVILRNNLTGAITVETAAVAKETLAKDSATMSQIKLNTAMLASPWFWIPAAIVGVIAVVDALTISYEEQVKKLQDVKKEYEDITSELDSVEQELKTTGEKIDELNAKDKLTITEQDELQKLKDTNEQLRIRKNLLENDKVIKQQEQNYEAILAAEKRFASGGRSTWDNLLQYVGAPFSQHYVEVIEGNTRGIQDYAIWGEKVAELQKRINTETDPSKLSAYNSQLAEYKSKLADARKELIGYSDSITGTDEASTQMKSKLEDNIDYINQFLFSAEELNKLKFDEIFNAESFEKSKEALLGMAKAGTLSPETITSYQEFNDLIETTGLTVEDIIAELQSLAKEAQQTSTGIEDALQGSIDNVLSLMDVVSEYDKEGEVSSQTIQKMLKDHPEYVRYLVQEGDQFKLNKDAIDDLATAEKQKNAITAEYIEKIKEQEFGTREFANTYSDFIRALSEAYPDSPLLQEMAQDLIDLNDSFAEGEITVNEYFDTLQERINSIDFNSVSLQSDEAMQGMFAGFTQATAQGLEYITKQFTSGAISVDEYTKSLTEANQNLLDLYTASNDLSLVDGQWKNAAGEIDEYANSLQNAQGAMDGFAPFISMLTDNVDYLSAHMDSFGRAAFTAADMADTSFQSLATNFEGYMEQLYTVNKEAFDAIVQDTANATGLMVSDITDGNGQIVDGIFQNDQALNTGINSGMSQLGKAVNAVTQAAGKVITALGETISNFQYKITVTPSQEGNIGDFINAFFGGGEYPKLSFDFTGSGSSGQAIGAALAAAGTAFSNLNLGSMFTLKSLKSSTPSTTSTAPRNTSSSKKSSSPKSKTADSDKEAQEAEKKRKERVQEYKDTIAEIERLDERYVNRQQGYGIFTDNDVLYALGERAKRYRQYAEEVLAIDYMTEEEQLQLYQEYNEKAEDLELQYFQDAQKRDEDFIQEQYDKRLAESENWIDYQKLLNAMSVDDEISAGRRIIEAADAMYEEIEKDMRLSADFRESMLDKINSVIEEYNEKEITLNQEKWDTIISDMQDATDKIIDLYDKLDQASTNWISEQKGRDMLSLGEELEAYDRILERWDEKVAEGSKKYKEAIAEMEQQRQELMASGNYTESSPEIKELDKMIEEEKEKLQDFLDDANWQYGELQNTRYNLYKDFLQEQVQDFIQAERDKVNAHYNALKEMEDQEDRDKKRRELEEQIKQYEGAVTKEGKEKLKDLLDQLEALDKEEKQILLDKQQEEELEALDQLEQGLLEQAKFKAQLVFNDAQVAQEIKGLIDSSDALAKEFADNFTKPFESYFKDTLPQQIRDAFEMPDITWLHDILNRIGGYNSSIVDDHSDNSKHVTYDVTVNTHSNADIRALLNAGG